MRKRLSKDRKFAGMLRENALIEELNSAESAAPFSLRGCRVPSKALFTAKHLTVFGLFRIALSKRRGENYVNPSIPKEKQINFEFNFRPSTGNF